VIGIVGGGLSGLACAHYLRRFEVPHLVLEAAARPGGVIRSGYVEGHLLEWGPQRTRLTEALRALLGELGLESELIIAPAGLPLYVFRAGRLRQVPFSVAEFARGDLLSLRGKLRLLAEPLLPPADDRESVATFFTRKLGREAYENLVGPLYGGLYASDPADMLVGLSLRHVLREFGIGRSLLVPLLRRGGRLAAPAACSFRAGMQMLPEALHRSNADNIRLASRVRRLTTSGRGYRLEVDGDTLDAEEVVLTVEAPSAAAVLAEVAPAAAQKIGQLVYNPLGVVHLHAETDLVGLGYQVSLTEPLYTRGVTFNDSLFQRRGVYTAYLGGASAPEVVEWSDARLAATAAREFRQVTGYEAAPISVARERMPAWDRSWAALQGLVLPGGLHLAANWESRPGIPGRLTQARRLAAMLAKGAAAAASR
jgi:protoporphyrinogen/coproporphyrinogen III oxidase